ncbi:MAG: Trehalose synthase/amylase TreS [Chlamydiae bacterium]|nr:Trehalose synthase/amylase TreS [Chlamydiota bacterium]
MGDEYWYKEAIIYEVHVKCFNDSSGDGIGDFKGLTEKLDYLVDLGVTAIWLLPFYPSPLKDDGYDIGDYRDVHPHYGTLNDFRKFMREAHRRGLRVITELVINHTSIQHPWFQKARQSPKGSKARDFYVWSDHPDRYQEARIIFSDFEQSNWAWDREAESYYWHRFYSHQPDLNFDNEEVHQAIFKILDFWLKMGVDGMRLDAIPYLYEREGTNCENLPETHIFLQKLRNHVETHFPDRTLLAEANQWPEDAAEYFGEGNECHMAFHFPVMPRLFMSIHLEDSLPIIEIMEQTPEIPGNCQWALFLRNHDELTLEMVTDEERDYMFRVYAHDPQARINLGIRRRLAPLLKNDRRKVELMNALLFSLAGTPVLYYGDEIGMGDNIYLGDRDGVRTPMQWSNDRNAGFSKANPQRLYLPPILDPEYHYETVNVEAQQNNPHSLLWWTKQLISLRKRYKAFSYGTTKFLLPENRKVLVFFREHQEELLMIIANLSRYPQYVELDLSQYNGYSLVEMFSSQRFPNIGELPYFLTLGGYGYYWFALEKVPKETPIQAIKRKKERQFPEALLKEKGERIFAPERRKILLGLIKRYLYRRSWFSHYFPMLDRTKTRLSDYSLIKTGTRNYHLVIIELGFTNGVIRRLPLILLYAQGEEAERRAEAYPENVLVRWSKGEKGEILYDASMDGEVASLFLHMMENKGRVRTENGELRGVALQEYEKRTSCLSTDEPVKVMREEDTILFTYEKGALRIFWDLEEGMNLDVEMRLDLTKKTSFRGFLPVIGYVEYRRLGMPKTAIAEELISRGGEYDAYSLSLEGAERFLMSIEARIETIPLGDLLPNRSWHSLATGELPQGIHQLIEEQTEVARHLGKTTGEFHKAIGSISQDSAYEPIPFNQFYQRSLYQTLRSKIAEAFTLLEKECKIYAPLLEYRERLLKSLTPLLKEHFPTMRTRYHGNFILQNLHYTGKDFLITNFEGNLLSSFSERRYKRSPLVDVASMLLSFHQVGFEAIYSLEERGVLRKEIREKSNKWAKSWGIWVGSAYIRAYLKTVEGSSFLPKEPTQTDFLLYVYLLEQSLEQILHGNKQEATEFLLHWLPIYGS